MRIQFLAVCAISAMLMAKVTDEGWRLHGGTQTDQRFSPLHQINEQSVSKLGLVWSKELGTSRGLEATPIVDGGIIYTTGSWNIVLALDARTGKTKWTYDPKVSRERAYFFCCDVVNRGVALHNGKIYVATLDGRLIALDQRTGAPLWMVQTTDPAKPYSITAAPRIAGDKVVIGNAGSEYGVRAMSRLTMRKPANKCGASTPFPETRKTGSNRRPWKSRLRPGTARNGGERVQEARRGRA